MLTETEKAVGRTTASKDKLHGESYLNCRNKSNEKRQEKIAARRAQIPRLYRAIYDRAVTGNSRKAAMHVFCLECCGWEIKEVFACTDSVCALYPYRSKSRASQRVPEGVSAERESKNSDKRMPE